MWLTARNETITDWLANTDGYNRFGIAVSKGTYINYLQFVKTSSGSGCVFATTDTGVVLTRRYSGGTLTGWVGQTTADVASTAITYTGFASNGPEVSSYLVRNGICYMTLCFSASSTPTGLVKIADCPKPVFSVSATAFSGDDENAARVSVYSDGLYAAGIQSGSTYFASLSYPVA